MPPDGRVGDSLDRGGWLAGLGWMAGWLVVCCYVCVPLARVMAQSLLLVRFWSWRCVVFVRVVFVVVLVLGSSWSRVAADDDVVPVDSVPVEVSVPDVPVDDWCTPAGSMKWSMLPCVAEIGEPVAVERSPHSTATPVAASLPATGLKLDIAIIAGLLIVLGFTLWACGRQWDDEQGGWR